MTVRSIDFESRNGLLDFVFLKLLKPLQLKRKTNFFPSPFPPRKGRLSFPCHSGPEFGVIELPDPLQRQFSVFPIHLVISPENRVGFVSADAHYDRIRHPRFAHIRDCAMAKVVKMEISQSSLLTSVFEPGLASR
jgi:hypothetical protein